MLLLYNACFVFKSLDEYQSVHVIFCSWVSQVVPEKTFSLGDSVY